VPILTDWTLRRYEEKGRLPTTLKLLLQPIIGKPIIDGLLENVHAVVMFIGADGMTTMFSNVADSFSFPCGARMQGTQIALSRAGCPI
jgi:hypothetical protein